MKNRTQEQLDRIQMAAERLEFQISELKQDAKHFDDSIIDMRRDDVERAIAALLGTLER